MFEHAITGSGRFAQCVPMLSEIDPDLTIAVLSEDVINNPELLRYCVKPSTRPARWLMAYWNKSQDYANAIEELLKSQQFDLIFFNDAWLGYHLLKRHEAIPVISAVRDDNAIRLQQNRIAALPGLAIRRYQEHTACRFSIGVITNSEFMANTLSLVYTMDRAKLYVLPPVYTDYTKIDGTILPISKTEPVQVLFIKHNAHRGGLDLLIKTLMSLSQHQFILTIVGPNATEITKKYAGIVKDTNLRLNIIGHEYDQSRVFALMKSHHIFCVPSRREAFGVANIEALASGMRVVFYPVGGIPEAVRLFGFPMNNRSVRSCRQSILEAIQMSEEGVAQRISAGQKWVQHTFSKDQIMTRLRDILSGIGQHPPHSTTNPKSRTA